MWISKKKYEELKQKRASALYDSVMYQSLYDDLKRDFDTLQSKYGKLIRVTSKLYKVEIYSSTSKSTIYNIEASSPEEAEQLAIYLFTNKSKGISASDIILMTVKPMNCAR